MPCFAKLNEFFSIQTVLCIPLDELVSYNLNFCYKEITLKDSRR